MLIVPEIAGQKSFSGEEQIQDRAPDRNGELCSHSQAYNLYDITCMVQAEASFFWLAALDKS